MGQEQVLAVVELRPAYHPLSKLLLVADWQPDLQMLLPLLVDY